MIEPLHLWKIYIFLRKVSLVDIQHLQSILPNKCRVKNVWRQKRSLAFWRPQLGVLTGSFSPAQWRCPVGWWAAPSYSYWWLCFFILQILCCTYAGCSGTVQQVFFKAQSAASFPNLEPLMDWQAIGLKSIVRICKPFEESLTRDFRLQGPNSWKHWSLNTVVFSSCFWKEISRVIDWFR